MNSVTQAILKDNPRFDVYGELALKTTDQQAALVEELARQQKAAGIEPFSELCNRVLALVEKRAGSDVAMEVDELIGSCMNTYADTGFALGYFTAKHPEWLIFEAHTPGESSVCPACGKPNKLYWDEEAKSDVCASCGRHVNRDDD